MADTGKIMPITGILEELSADLLIALMSDGLNSLPEVSSSAVTAEHSENCTFENISDVKEDIAQKTVRLEELSLGLYQKCLDCTETEFDQLIMTLCYLQNGRVCCMEICGPGT